MTQLLRNNLQIIVQHNDDGDGDEDSHMRKHMISSLLVLLIGKGEKTTDRHFDPPFVNRSEFTGTLL